MSLIIACYPGLLLVLFSLNGQSCTLIQKQELTFCRYLLALPKAFHVDFLLPSFLHTLYFSFKITTSELDPGELPRSLPKQPLAWPRRFPP